MVFIFFFLLACEFFSCYDINMKTPTIIKKTKDSLFIKVPFPKTDKKAALSASGAGKTRAEVRLWKVIQEWERDVREGRVITAKSVRETPAVMTENNGIKIRYSARFLKSLRRLPQSVLAKQERSEAIFRKNPFDPRLKIHQSLSSRRI